MAAPEHTLTTTLDSGRTVTTRHDGSEADARAIHVAEVLVARETSGMREACGAGDLDRLCTSLNRLTLACGSLARLVGSNVSPWGIVDLDAMPAGGTAPPVLAFADGSSIIAWDADRVLGEFASDDDKRGPWRVLPRADVAGRA
jgi:hypothetical protein